VKNLADECLVLQIRSYQLRAEQLRTMAEKSGASHCRDDLLSWAALYDNWVEFMKELQERQP
jgi:hypothetical protein